MEIKVVIASGVSGKDSVICLGWVLVKVIGP